MLLTPYRQLDDNVIKRKIDDLTYFYHNDSNQIASVADAEDDPNGFAGGSGTESKYEYDAYGNMILDKTKRITGTSYNHQNLPVMIQFDDGGDFPVISYIYNARGIKVRKVVEPAGRKAVVTTTDYLDGYQYVNTSLQFFPHAEGYVKSTRTAKLVPSDFILFRSQAKGDHGYTLIKDANIFSYVYNYTDHLGNVRLSYENNNNVLRVLEEKNYYPFGLSHVGYNSVVNGYNPNRYLFNNKELQEELGLNWYDFGGRAYMPDIVRTPQIDPMAEKFYNTSPYVFFNNNPVFFIDPDGMAPLPYNDDIITKVSNTRGDKHYKQRDVNMTMTLTVVNSIGADLSKTMFNKSSGTIALSGLSGNALSDNSTVNRAPDISTSDNLMVSVSYKVVGSLADIGKDDHVMVITNNIPIQVLDKVDPCWIE